MTKEREEPEFTVTDKRLFREDGELRPNTDRTEPVKPESKEPAQEPGPARDLGAEPPPGSYPEIDFPSYILSYYTQGLVLLGEVPNPYTNKKEEDTEAARHTIDILAMLQEKTKGNLGKEEEQLLNSILYELRMKFMAKTSRIKL
jgi:hypothetical protein